MKVNVTKITNNIQSHFKTMEGTCKINILDNGAGRDGKYFTFFPVGWNFTC